MLDLAFVRENFPLVQQKLAERGLPAALDSFQEVDQQRRRVLTEVETLKNQRNKASDEIGLLKKNRQDATARIAEMKQLSEKIQRLDVDVEQLDGRLRDILVNLPNVPHSSVPVGSSAEQNVEVRRWGQPCDFSFQPRAHWELGEALGILDLGRAAKISGARFAVYWDSGAKLERALANFMLDVHAREHGYREVLPPAIINAASLFGTGQLPKFAEDLFKIPGNTFEPNPHRRPEPGEIVGATGKDSKFRVLNVLETEREAEIQPVSDAGQSLGTSERVPWSGLFFRRDLYLSPTAEVPVTNLYRDEVLDSANLPISLMAYTPCFRSEAGSYGKDTRGIIRVHQFQKVELVKFAHPTQSYQDHENLTQDAESILQKLGLPYRVMSLCTGDLGFGAAKTYDLEVWIPSEGKYREISSCSNYETFQARRANIRFRTGGKGKSEFVHTLNGSGLAVGRTWIAIVENYQQEDGSVLIPEALRPYMGTERITRSAQTS